MKSILFLFLLAVAIGAHGQEEIKTPAQFLGYELGTRFTAHHRAVDYFRYIADIKANVELREYGTTYEGRPLVYTIVASNDNFKKLERIRTDNLKRAGLLSGTPSEKVAIVWLSYNVHGNEASSLEASMKTLFELTNEKNTAVQSWLKNTVVILDPCVNPDGRDRYANFYRQFGNFPANANEDAKERREPWPSGRTNHYMFDLNRDWAWQTQIESTRRIKVYNEWLPHVHVDFHEQGHNYPYYFAPAAEPMHEVITPWQREFQTMIGKNNAKYFDKEGWLYFTKEVFDLFYPSYGDTYPTFSGAIGMTYEQAGGGFAGLNITTETGDPLTLVDRLTHHHTTGMSTIEITSQNAEQVVDEFAKYYRESATTPASTYKTYVVKSDNNPDKITTLTAWLSTHGIRYGHTNAKTSRGFDFQTQASTNVNVSGEDLVISAYQPKSKFITTVFEPVSKLPDSLTYDITAWNLFYAFDLKAYALNEKLNVISDYKLPSKIRETSDDKAYAYIFKYNSVNDARFLATLLKNGLRVRSSERSFDIGGKTYPPGTLVISRGNNSSVGDFDMVLDSLARASGRAFDKTLTGFVDKGKDLGSGDLNLIKAPEVAMLFGEQTSSLSAGEIWYFFEQELRYPITQIGTDYVKSVNLHKYDVLIIPEGSYRLFDDSFLEMIGRWVDDGGRLILIGNSINSFTERKGFNIKKYASEEQKSEAERKAKVLKEKEGFPRYETTERRIVSETISGAIYKIAIDNSHPLGFGLGNHYFTLKNNELRFGFLEDGWNVGLIKGPAKPVQGFAGFKSNASLTDTMVFGVQTRGDGEVVYLVDNPLFRCFWENGKLLFSNAVFMVGQ